MKKIALAAFMLSAAMTYQAFACDWNHEASKAPVILACQGSDCGATAPVAQEPTAKPETVAPKVACDGSGCATEEPATSTPIKTACSGSDC